MASRFSRTDTEPVTLPGRYAPLLAFLADLHEQVEMQIAITAHPSVLPVLVELQQRIAAAGLIVQQLASGCSEEPPCSGS